MSLRALGLGRFGPWRYIAAFTVGVLSICAATATLVHRDYEGAKSEWHSRLGTVAEDRASVVSGYLQSRLQDAEAWADMPIFRTCLTPRAGGYGKPQEAAHDALDGVLIALNSTYAYPAASSSSIRRVNGLRLRAQSTNSDRRPPTCAVRSSVVARRRYRSSTAPHLFFSLRRRSGCMTKQPALMGGHRPWPG
jgi:hypothetical protein